MNTHADISFGTRLKAAREKLHLSEKDVASRLNLNARIIIALDNEDLSAAAPITFMRGYLRSYACLLGFSKQESETFVKQLEQKMPETAPAITSPNLRPLPSRKKYRYMRWASYGLACSLIVLVSVWWNTHSNYPATDLAMNKTPTADTTQPAVTPMTTPETVEKTPENTTPKSSATKTAHKHEAENDDETPAATPPKTLADSADNNATTENNPDTEVH